MSTTWTPNMTEEIVEIKKVTEPKLDLPPQGTRIRATLGESVLVGTILHDNMSKGSTFHFEFDGLAFSGFRQVVLWFESGWTFEILDDAPAETLDRELAEVLA